MSQGEPGTAALPPTTTLEALIIEHLRLRAPALSEREIRDALRAGSPDERQERTALESARARARRARARPCAPLPVAAASHGWPR